MIRKVLKRILFSVFILFLTMNCVAWFHASTFTHFSSSSSVKTPERLSFGQKLMTIFTGIDNPRPENSVKPDRPFQTIKLKSNKEIECWYIGAESPGGTIILFHGYGGDKSSMLDKAEVFLSLGYNTLLVDFMGSGGSEGNQTTIGYYEAEEVKTAFDYLKEKGEKKIVLFGTSMGAVAIMKAINDYTLEPASIIIECPFGTMLETVEARFEILKIPSFPMAELLVFWGGVQNDFNAFKHNPVEYAKAIKCPVLLLYGEKDHKVSWEETDKIFNNIPGAKTLRKYPLAGHENYLNRYSAEWQKDVEEFICK